MRTKKMLILAALTFGVGTIMAAALTGSARKINQRALRWR
jgi:hypothetical protein